ncbi:MAG: hypothetical protein NZZ41_08145 [Candidatus Dojkabacteria bacterium]|nr:hypothetical protein [Candidatus Dojkabacteria bacterium]
MDNLVDFLCEILAYIMKFFEKDEICKNFSLEFKFYDDINEKLIKIYRYKI